MEKQKVVKGPQNTAIDHDRFSREIERQHKACTMLRAFITYTHDKVISLDSSIGTWCGSYGRFKKLVRDGGYGIHGESKRLQAIFQESSEQLMYQHGLTYGDLRHKLSEHVHSTVQEEIVEILRSKRQELPLKVKSSNILLEETLMLTYHCYLDETLGKYGKYRERCLPTATTSSPEATS